MGKGLDEVIRFDLGMGEGPAIVADLDGQVPNGVSIIVRTSVGEEIEAGTVGG